MSDQGAPQATSTVPFYSDAVVCPVCGAPDFSCTNPEHTPGTGGVTIVQMPNRDRGTGMADQAQGPVEYSAENPHGRQLTEKEAAALTGGVSMSSSSSSDAGDGGTDYSSMTVADLRAAAKDAGITGASNLRKDELVEQLNAQPASGEKAQPADATPNKAAQPADAGTKDSSSGSSSAADSGGE